MKEWQINCQGKLTPERKLVTWYNSYTNDHSREQPGKIEITTSHKAMQEPLSCSLVSLSLACWLSKQKANWNKGFGAVFPRQLSLGNLDTKKDRAQQSPGSLSTPSPQSPYLQFIQLFQ